MGHPESFEAYHARINLQARQQRCSKVTVEFTAHNIRLDDGTCTRSGTEPTMESDPWFLSAKRILETVFPGDRGAVRLADLGCLEGGYAVEFARMGFEVLGVEVRDSNIAACEYVKSRTNLPNLSFVKDDVWNIAGHGSFDVVFCSGLLYHMDKPKGLLELISAVTTRLAIIQTHFADAVRDSGTVAKFGLSGLDANEGLPGRWFTEFANDEAFANRDSFKWAAWENRRSFWIQREYLLQALLDAGFETVLEQFDSLGPDIARSMLGGYYAIDSRGTFIGIKSAIGTVAE